MGKKVLRALGIWGYIAFGVFALLFVLGETLDDPGTSNGVAFKSWVEKPRMLEQVKERIGDG